MNRQEIFQKQFIISPKRCTDRGFDQHTKINALYINHYERNDFIDVVNQSGEPIGLIIGYPIDFKNKKIISHTLTLDCEGDLDSAIEQDIYSLSGSFIFILDHDEQRIYLDTNGSLSIVYDEKTGLIGSTASALLSDEEYSSRFNTELYSHLDVDKEGWFPAGLTAHRGIKRLLCNHYLDIKKSTPHRHWPISNFEPTCSAQDCSQGITEIIQHTIETISKYGNLICALTAGNETRYITSALFNKPVKADYFTIDFDKSSCDINAARKISDRLNLNWKSIPAIYSSSEEKEIWIKQVAHCISGNNLYIHKTLDNISDYDFFVGGLGGEIGRAFIWKDSDTNATILSAESIIKRLGLSPDNQELKSATEEWLKGVSQFDSLTILELAYIELRMSAWAFSQAYANPKKQIEVNPMICREAYSLMLSLKPEDKISGRFIKTGIKLNCPELSDIPINKFGDYRDLVHLLKKINLNNLKKKARKVFG